MKYVDYEEEINVLESALGNLESAIGDIQDSPYHSHLAQSWELDKDDIQNRLNELYELQNDQWAAEIQEMNMEFEVSRLWVKDLEQLIS